MGDQKYTRADVAGRNGRNGAPLWLIIKDVVYDVSAYLQEHPGGEDALQEQAGKDATKDFEGVGHSVDAKAIMKKYKIGEIVEKKEKKEEVKCSAKGPAKPSLLMIRPKMPPTGSPSKPKESTNRPTSTSTGLPPRNLPCFVPSSSVTADVLDSSIALTGPALEAAICAPLASTAIATGVSVCTLSALNGGVSSELTTGVPSVDTLGLPAEVSIRQSIDSPKIQDTVAINGTLATSDAKPGESIASMQASTANTSPVLLSRSSVTPVSSATSIKSLPAQPGVPTILQGLSKASISTKPVPKQAQQPWSAFSQSGKQTNPSFKSPVKISSSKGQHDPFKNNKMATGGYKKK